jgi:acyl-coenzyme A synthetase/AMP-(fatty) acid ligase
MSVFVNYSSSWPCCYVIFCRTVANALDTMFHKGDRIAIDMPMTCNAVIIYLAIVLGGFVVVSIADSFAPGEIGTRMGVSKAEAIFTQVRD